MKKKKNSGHELFASENKFREGLNHPKFIHAKPFLEQLISATFILRVSIPYFPVSLGNSLLKKLYLIYIQINQAFCHRSNILKLL